MSKKIKHEDRASEFRKQSAGCFLAAEKVLVQLEEKIRVAMAFTESHNVRSVLAQFQMDVQEATSAVNNARNYAYMANPGDYNKS